MKFVAFERSKQGTGASRRLRISGRTPGIVYGGEGQPEMIEVDHNALWHALKSEAFHSSILDMELGGKTSRVLLRDVQMHPFKQLVLHIDFQRVTTGTKMHVKVPLHFNGADESPAVKLDHCVANFVMTELDIECLPRDLPEFIAVDVSGLTKSGMVHLSDVQLPNGVKAITHGNDNPVLVTAVMVSVVEDTPEGEVAAPAAGAAAPDATKEDKE